MRRPTKFLLVFLAVIGCLFLFGRFWLFPAMGSFLIRDEQPCRADAALTLAGDFRGNRVRGASNLVRQGFAPKLLVSGAAYLFDLPESELARSVALRAGLVPNEVEAVQMQVYSTRAELRALVPVLQQRGIKSVILVTSDFHTYRAGWLARRTPGFPTVCIAAAPSRAFDPNDWWNHREQIEVMFDETVRIINSWREEYF